jgi:hypothetical protein
MCAAEYHLGRWVPGDPDAPPGILIEFQWGIPGKTLIDAEYRMVERRQVPVSQGFAGYHYGTQEIHWMMFARDGIRPFEVMNVGRIELLPGDVMVRHYRSYDPDTSSREYRETLSPTDANTSIIPTTGGSILRKLATGAVVAAFAAGPSLPRPPRPSCPIRPSRASRSWKDAGASRPAIRPFSSIRSWRSSTSSRRRGWSAVRRCVRSTTSDRTARPRLRG